ncbi:MAG: redoxin family protein [Candidatus Eisenbacteria bacterium]|nr:redoxin family protein [Candidatus Eisenbacteria bacterium]
MSRWRWPRSGSLTLATALAAVLILACSPKEKEVKEPPAPIALGAKVPGFTLKDTDGIEHRLSDSIGKKMVVLEWFNPECPFIKKHHQANKTMNDLYDAMKDDVFFFAINSSAPGMQGHGLEKNRRAKEEFGLPYPILIDESGEVGRLYKAKTTPHVFVICLDGTLIYRGALDDDPSVGTLGSINYVRVALEQCMGNRTISVRETKPYGCSVKYAAGEHK